jgi:hypothetical protein
LISAPSVREPKAAFVVKPHIVLLAWRFATLQGVELDVRRHEDQVYSASGILVATPRQGEGRTTWKDPQAFRVPKFRYLPSHEIVVAACSIFTTQTISDKLDDDKVDPAPTGYRWEPIVLDVEIVSL